jgi:cytochrome b6-f complex iron-sulfur subunit
MDMKYVKISRRKFFVKSGGTLAAVCAGGLLSTILNSCKGNGPSGPSNVAAMTIIQASASNNEISISLDASSPIAARNTRAVIEYAGQSEAILAEHNQDDTYRAISGVCTHQGCFVTDYDGTNNVFVCPCHGSRFDLNGNVVQGPAPSKLIQYNTRVENNSLIITL